MKFFQIAKRIALFMLVNLLVLLTISLVLNFLLPAFGIKLQPSSTERLLVFCFIWGMGGAFISLLLSRFMAKMMMGVQVVDPRTNDPHAREIVEMVYELAQEARLPKMPEVGIYQSPEVNAFATGPSKSRSLVAVSTGLLQNMNRREVRGVIAHEVAHIANGDMVTMTLVQGIINAFVMFFARIAASIVGNALRRDDDEGPGFFLQYLLVMVFEIIFSLFGMIVVCWFSRWREFRADAGAARYANKADMIAALKALQQITANPHAQFHRDDAFQVMQISGGRGGLLAMLFSTHPPLESRIAALERLP
jgi:heat shock protein HtpX